MDSTIPIMFRHLGTITILLRLVMATILLRLVMAITPILCLVTVTILLCPGIMGTFTIPNDFDTTDTTTGGTLATTIPTGDPAVSTRDMVVVFGGILSTTVTTTGVPLTSAIIR